VNHFFNNNFIDDDYDDDYENIEEIKSLVNTKTVIITAGILFFGSGVIIHKYRNFLINLINHRLPPSSKPIKPTQTIYFPPPSPPSAPTSSLNAKIKNRLPTFIKTIGAAGFCAILFKKITFDRRRRIPQQIIELPNKHNNNNIYNYIDESNNNYIKNKNNNFNNNNNAIEINKKHENFINKFLLNFDEKKFNELTKNIKDSPIPKKYWKTMVIICFKGGLFLFKYFYAPYYQQHVGAIDYYTYFKK
jgi:hypothetical protein